MVYIQNQMLDLFFVRAIICFNKKTMLQENHQELDENIWLIAKMRREVHRKLYEKEIFELQKTLEI